MKDEVKKPRALFGSGGALVLSGFFDPGPARRPGGIVRGLLVPVFVGAQLRRISHPTDFPCTASGPSCWD